jgi:CelD/BcsL family acetyltransferase involved in cellulose biosynthesis
MDQFVVKLIRTEEGLKGLAADWIQLHEKVLPRNPFLSYEWSINYWQYLCPPCTPFLLTVWHDSVLVGLLPLRLERKWGFRLLRFLADGRSDYLGFLVAPNHDSVFEVLTESLYQHTREWDCCFLRKLHDRYTAQDLTSAGEGYRVVQVNSGVAPYLSLSGDWNELCSKGPSQIRQAQRKLKKFKRQGGTVERSAGADCRFLCEQIKRIEYNSWKSSTNVAKFQTVNEQKMLAQVLDTFGSRDEVEVWLARLHAEPIAFLINFLTPERTLFYQTAYDEKYGEHSPGTILCFLAVEKTWKAGLREFDFMDGPEPFKKRWTNNERELKKLVIFPKSLRGYLGFIALAVDRAYQKYLPTRTQ